MKYKPLFLVSVSLFVISFVTIFVNLFMVYDLAGTSSGDSSVTAAAVAQLTLAQLINTICIAGLVISGVLFALWLALTLRHQFKTHGK